MIGGNQMSKAKWLKDRINFVAVGAACMATVLAICWMFGGFGFRLNPNSIIDDILVLFTGTAWSLTALCLDFEANWFSYSDVGRPEDTLFRLLLAKAISLGGGLALAVHLIVSASMNVQGATSEQGYFAGSGVIKRPLFESMSKTDDCNAYKPVFLHSGSIGAVTTISWLEESPPRVALMSTRYKAQRSDDFVLENQQFVEVLLGVEKIIVIANADAPRDDLTIDELKEIIKSKDKEWPTLPTSTTVEPPKKASIFFPSSCRTSGTCSEIATALGVLPDELMTANRTPSPRNESIPLLVSSTTGGLGIIAESTYKEFKSDNPKSAGLIKQLRIKIDDKKSTDNVTQRGLWAYFPFISTGSNYMLEHPQFVKCILSASSALHPPGAEVDQFWKNQNSWLLNKPKIEKHQYDQSEPLALFLGSDDKRTSPGILLRIKNLPSIQPVPLMPLEPEPPVSVPDVVPPAGPAGGRESVVPEAGMPEPKAPESQSMSVTPPASPALQSPQAATTAA